MSPVFGINPNRKGIKSRSEGLGLKLIRGAADGDHPDVLAIRYAAIQVQIPLKLICVFSVGAYYGRIYDRPASQRLFHQSNKGARGRVPPT